MTEKRFTYIKFDIVDFEELKLYEIDNNPSDDLDESNLFYVYSKSEVNIKRIVDKLNTLMDENEQLKQDKKRLIGFLHRYKGVDVEDIDEEILSKDYLDEWGELYDDER